MREIRESHMGIDLMQTQQTIDYLKFLKDNGVEFPKLKNEVTLYVNANGGVFVKKHKGKSMYLYINVLKALNNELYEYNSLYSGYFWDWPKSRLHKEIDLL